MAKFSILYFVSRTTAYLLGGSDRTLSSLSSTQAEFEFNRERRPLRREDHSKRPSPRHGRVQVDTPRALRSSPPAEDGASPLVLAGRLRHRVRVAEAVARGHGGGGGGSHGRLVGQVEFGERDAGVDPSVEVARPPAGRVVVDVDGAAGAGDGACGPRILAS